MPDSQRCLLALYLTNNERNCVVNLFIIFQFLSMSLLQKIRSSLLHRSAIENYPTNKDNLNKYNICL